MSNFARLLITANNGNSSYVTVVELELHDTDTYDTNVAVGGVATADSEANASNIASFAFDGNLNTKWTSNSRPSPTVPKWLQYQLPSSTPIKGYSIVGCIAGQETYAPRNWEFQISFDGFTWVTVDTQVDQSFTAGERKTYSIPYYTVTGTTKINGVLSECVVRLYHRDTGSFVDSTTSDNITGEYTLIVPKAGVDYDILCIPLDDSVCPAVSGPIQVIVDT